jgi:hypothetical protein
LYGNETQFLTLGQENESQVSETKTGQENILA